MKIMFCLLAVGVLAGAEAPRTEAPKAEPKKNEAPKLPNREEFTYTSAKPCPIDKYHYFCCPVARSVRVGSKGKFIWYYYNARDEIIGRRGVNSSERNSSSSFVALGTNCTQCGKSMTKIHTWDSRWQNRLAPPKKKK